MAKSLTLAKVVSAALVVGSLCLGMARSASCEEPAGNGHVSAPSSLPAEPSAHFAGSDPQSCLDVDLYTEHAFAGLSPTSVYVSALHGRMGNAQVNLVTEQDYAGLWANSVYIQRISGQLGNESVTLESQIRYTKGEAAYSVIESRFTGYVGQRATDLATQVASAGWTADSVFIAGLEGSMGEYAVNLRTSVKWAGTTPATVYVDHITGTACKN